MTKLKAKLNLIVAILNHILFGICIYLFMYTDDWPLLPAVITFMVTALNYGVFMNRNPQLMKKILRLK